MVVVWGAWLVPGLPYYGVGAPWAWGIGGLVV